MADILKLAEAFGRAEAYEEECKLAHDESERAEREAHQELNKANLKKLDARRILLEACVELFGKDEHCQT